MAPEDFFLLLAYATGKEKVFLLAHPEYELAPKEKEQAEQYLARRLKHEPVAYIVGHKEFYGREFRVTPSTLIPRPETELLIESALNAISNFPWPRPATAGRQFPISKNIDIVDIGTGSGNIIITLAKEIKTKYPILNTRYYALDISPQALAIARKNAQAHDSEKKIDFVESDLLQKFLLPQKKNRHAIITANLPYLSSSIYQESSPDVHDYEPRTALESGHDGLDHYRMLFEMLPHFSQHYLSTTFFLEISPEQSEALEATLTHLFPTANIRLFQDLAGKDRLIQATI